MKKYKKQMIDVLSFIEFLVNNLNLSTSVKIKARELLEKNKGMLSKKDSKTLASALVYISATLCGERRTYKEVGNVLKVSSVSISKTVKHLNI